MLPGDRRVKTISEVFKEGGTALGSDVISKLLSLPKEQPQRYLIIQPSTIDNVIYKISGFDMSKVSSLISNKSGGSLSTTM